MRYAFDYKTFTDTVVNGFGIRARSGIPKGLLGYDERIPLVEYDPVKAKEYFLKAKAAGAYKDGDIVTMYYNTGNEPRRRGCLLFKDAIEKLGVGLTINVQELDWPTFLAKIRTKELPIFFVGWAPDYADPDDYAIPFYDGRKGTFAIRVGYNNDTINKLIDQASTELDPKKRAELYLEIQREVNEEAVYIWTVQPMYTFVMRDWVKGFQFNAALATCSDGLGLYRLLWKEERTEQVAV
jgi:peptide/nickel transport system substrate-binding protein